eukprot:m.25024 g.25024  ORF g.25024 m.25024 type:complete len:226 (-) comp7667_c0_seq1:1401-2078(-)
MAEEYHEYLNKHDLFFYIEDAITRLLDVRWDTTKTPTEFMAKYFSLVTQGKHVAFQNFKYITATTYNRISFLHILEGLLVSVERKSEFLTVADHESLVGLLCKDFPLTLLQRCTNPKCGKDTPIRCSEFLKSFEYHFLLQEFVETTKKAYKAATFSDGSPPTIDALCEEYDKKAKMSKIRLQLGLFRLALGSSPIKNYTDVLTRLRESDPIRELIVSLRSALVRA